MSNEKIHNQRFGLMLFIFWLITLKIMGSDISNDNTIELIIASMVSIPWTLPGALIMGFLVLAPLNYLLNGRVAKWLFGE